MTSVLAFNPLSATDYLSTFGTIGVLLVLLAETGLLIGFFLPGDSLLFTAGLLSATGAGSLHLSLLWVLVAAAVGALAGAQVGFLIGRAAGAALVTRTSRPRLAAGMRKAEVLFTRYGPAKAIVLARFVPVVRTVLNPLAGALHIPAATFTLWQAVGGLGWTVGLVLAGYALGSFIPGVDQYLLPVIALVVVVSLIPLIREVLRERRRSPGTGREQVRQ
jgi:membrane-associated protein